MNSLSHSPFILSFPTAARRKLRAALTKTGFTEKNAEKRSIFEKGQEKITVYNTGTVSANEYVTDSTIGVLVSLKREELQLPEAGTDESGKGDFFGPLVISGAVITEENFKYILLQGIRDSKKIRDEKILQLFKGIQKKHLIYDTVVIMPYKYNALFDTMKNLNRILAWAHARVIENIAKKTHVNRIIIDKFASSSLINRAMFENGVLIPKLIVEKGEKHLSCALASIIARATFLLKMKELSLKYGMTFPTGSGQKSEAAAKEFVKKYSKDALAKVAKMHFKTAAKI